MPLIGWSFDGCACVYAMRMPCVCAFSTLWTQANVLVGTMFWHCLMHFRRTVVFILVVRQMMICSSFALRRQVCRQQRYVEYWSCILTPPYIQMLEENIWTASFLDSSDSARSTAVCGRCFFQLTTLPLLDTKSLNLRRLQWLWHTPHGDWWMIGAGLRSTYRLYKQRRSAKLVHAKCHVKCVCENLWMHLMKLRIQRFDPPGLCGCASCRSDWWRPRDWLHGVDRPVFQVSAFVLSCPCRWFLLTL